MAAGRRHWRRTVALTTLLALVATVLLGCGGSATSADTDRRAIQHVLSRRASALLAGERQRFLAAADPRASGTRAQQAREFDNLRDLPIDTWSYRVVRTGGFTPALGSGRRVAVTVELRYRLAGFDTGAVSAERHVTAVSRDDHWYIAADTPAAGPTGKAAQQLWEQGRIVAVRGEHSLVLGVGQSRGRLTEIARTADRAVPEVTAAWHGGWAGRVVVHVPASLDRMAALLGSTSAAYRGIAAVTTGEVTGRAAAAADRVTVNPEGYDELDALGRRIVLTHETTHVATRRQTTEATPLWLSEGFADWVGYHGVRRTPRQAAPELTRAVRAGDAPTALPTNGAFRFDGAPERLAQAYEQGWLACRMIADQWGEDELVDFYRRVGAADTHTQREAVARAARQVLGIDGDDFRARWTRYVVAQLGGGPTP